MKPKFRHGRCARVVGWSQKLALTVVLEACALRRIEHGRGGAVLVDGAMGVFRDVSFHELGGLGGALLVTSGSSLDWISGQATENCARLVEAGRWRSRRAQAILVGVSVQGSVCRVLHVPGEARLGLPTVLVPQRGG